MTLDIVTVSEWKGCTLIPSDGNDKLNEHYCLWTNGRFVPFKSSSTDRPHDGIPEKLVSCGNCRHVASEDFPTHYYGCIRFHRHYVSRICDNHLCRLTFNSVSYQDAMRRYNEFIHVLSTFGGSSTSHDTLQSSGSGSGYKLSSSLGSSSAPKPQTAKKRSSDTMTKRLSDNVHDTIHRSTKHLLHPQSDSSLMSSTLSSTTTMNSYPPSIWDHFQTTTTLHRALVCIRSTLSYANSQDGGLNCIHLSRRTIESDLQENSSEKNTNNNAYVQVNDSLILPYRIDDSIGYGDAQMSTHHKTRVLPSEYCWVKVYRQPTEDLSAVQFQVSLVVSSDCDNKHDPQQPKESKITCINRSVLKSCIADQLQDRYLIVLNQLIVLKYIDKLNRFPLLLTPVRLSSSMLIGTCGWFRHNTTTMEIEASMLSIDSIRWT